jgi:type I restriction enzyme S subunit
MTGTKGKRDYGYVAMINNEKKLLLNQRLVRLRFIPPLEPKFFLIALQSEDYRNRFFASETGNVGQGNAMMSVVTEEHIMVPPLEEQRRIVAEVERRLSVGGEVESVVEKALVRAGRLRQAVLRHAFEGKLF